MVVNKLLILGGAAAVAVAGAAWWLSQPDSAPQVADGPVVSPMHSGADREAPAEESSVIVPELSAMAAGGKIAYEATCAACHGINAAGTDNGPPLIHNLYRPAHHSDAAFSSAAANGVIAHHWQFGNMPPVVGGVPEYNMRWIVRYIREMQQANGVR